jgi:ferredoxin
MFRPERKRSGYHVLLQLEACNKQPGQREKPYENDQDIKDAQEACPYGFSSMI